MEWPRVSLMVLKWSRSTMHSTNEPPCSRALRDLDLEPLQQRPAVRQTGQRVGQGQIADLLLRASPLGDVATNRLILDDRVADGPFGPLLPADAAVRLHRLELDGHDIARAEPGDRVTDDRTCRCRHEVDEPPADQLVRLPPEMPAEGAVDEGQGGVGKVPADQLGLILHDGTIAILALAQGQDQPVRAHHQDSEHGRDQEGTCQRRQQPDRLRATRLPRQPGYAAYDGPGGIAELYVGKPGARCRCLAEGEVIEAEIAAEVLQEGLVEATPEHEHGRRARRHHERRATLRQDGTRGRHEEPGRSVQDARSRSRVGLGGLSGKLRQPLHRGSKDRDGILRRALAVELAVDRAAIAGEHDAHPVAEGGVDVGPNIIVSPDGIECQQQVRHAVVPARIVAHGIADALAQGLDALTDDALLGLALDLVLPQAADIDGHPDQAQCQHRQGRDPARASTRRAQRRPQQSQPRPSCRREGEQVRRGHERRSCQRSVNGSLTPWRPFLIRIASRYRLNSEVRFQTWALSADPLPIAGMGSSNGTAGMRTGWGRAERGEGQADAS